MRRSLGILILFAVAVSAPAEAQPVSADAAHALPAGRGVVPGEPFGPLVVIEDIEVIGNGSTQKRLILRALPVKKGDAIRQGDRRFAELRYKVLALGYFRDVALKLSRGSRRGHVVLTVVVVERGTLTLERMYFGTTRLVPWWTGLDLSERNFFGTGVGIGAAFVYSGQSDALNGDSQVAGQLRFSDPSLFGSHLGGHLTLQYTSANEPFRIAGKPDDDGSENFAAFDYRRVGGKLGVSLRTTPLSRVVLDGRLEFVDADKPDSLVRERPNGTFAPVEFLLKEGHSRVATIAVGFDRDTRADPVLPFNGSRIAVLGEFGATWLGGSYESARALAQYGKWWPLGNARHVISAHLTGGMVLGNAPLFDRLYVGDINKLLTPRALGLVLSGQTSRDFLGTGTDEAVYGQLGGIAEVQYSYQLFRRSSRIYGGDIFFGAGLWGLGNTEELQVRDTSAYRALPLDLVVDAGLRLDTEIGVFELSIANGLGRVPF